MTWYTYIVKWLPQYGYLAHPSPHVTTNFFNENFKNILVIKNNFSQDNMRNLEFWEMYS